MNLDEKINNKQERGVVYGNIQEFAYIVLD